ncbi:MAG: hypothetical protein ABJN65_01070 [Parasphingorhabdus sp.]
MAAFHELKGSPLVLQPLMMSGLPKNVTGLLQFGWHVGTVQALGIGALFALAVWHPAGNVFAMVATIMSGAMGVIAIGLALFTNKALWSTPAPYPWNLIALMGLLGLLVG